MEVTLQSEPTEGKLDITGPGFSVSLDGGTQSQGSGFIGQNGEVSLRPAAPLGIGGTGYAPGSLVGVYLLPMPSGSAAELRVTGTLWWSRTVSTVAAAVTGVVDLGMATVDDSGTFATSVSPPPATPAGDYVLQLVGATPENASRVLSLAVRVSPQETAKTLTITGTRQKIGKRSSVTVSGTSEGLAGQMVTPWFKLRGERIYRQGSVRKLVQQDGSFTWQRRGGKKIYIYFLADNGAVRSNTLTIR